MAIGVDNRSYLWIIRIIEGMEYRIIERNEAGKDRLTMYIGDGPRGIYPVIEV